MKKGKLIKKAAAILTVAAIVGTLTGCGGDTASESSTGTDTENTANADSGEDLVIKVGMGNSAMYGSQLVLAQELGYFDEAFADLDYNVSVEVYRFAGGPAFNEAFLAEEIDAAVGIGDQPCISGILNDNGALIVSRVGSNTKGVGVVAREGSGIETGADLKGKIIATGVGTAYQKCFDLYLADYGLTEDDVELVDLYTTDELLAAFQSGEIDAAATGISYLKKQAEEAGLGYLVSDFSDHPNYSYLAMTDKFVSEHEDVTLRFLEALLRANDWYDENKEEAYEILAEAMEVTVEEIQTTNDDIVEEMVLTEEDIENFQVTYDFMEANDLLPSTTDDLSILYDTQYIERARENVNQ